MTAVSPRFTTAARKSDFLIFSCFALAALAMTLSQLALTFDGSYYLVNLLEAGAPFTPHNRLGAAVFQWPALAARDSGLVLASSLFCLSYACVPLAVILLCWLAVGKHQGRLTVWPLFALSLAAMPAQLIPVSESLIASQFAWVLLLAVLTPLSPLKAAVLLVLSAWLATLHPVASVYLLLCALACAAIRRTAIQESRLAQVLAACLTVLAAVRLVYMYTVHSGYEMAMLAPGQFRQCAEELFFCTAGQSSLSALAAGAAWLFTARTGSFRLFCLSCGLCLVSAAAALYWTTQAQFWFQSFAYIRLSILFYCPLMICAFADRVAGSRGRAPVASFSTILSCLLALLHLTVTLSETAVWRALTNRLKLEIAESPAQLVDMDSIDWLRLTPFHHWSAPSYAILLQGRAPAKLLLPEWAIERVEKGQGVFLADWEPSPSGRWFRLPTVARR